MSNMMFEIVVQAEGEVRDAEGNLISSTLGRLEAKEPVKMTVSADELRAMGIEPPTSPVQLTTDFRTGQTTTTHPEQE